MLRRQERQPTSTGVAQSSAGILVISLLVFLQTIAAQSSSHQRGPSWNLALDDGTNAAIEGGERVDKSSSSMGDLFWKSIPGEQQQSDWLRQLGQSTGYVSPYYLSPDGGPSRYHALVDEFKQYSPLANPSREGRAFKPKLMSTARGFGKRAYQDPNLQGNPLTYSEFLAAANQDLMNTNRKMSGNSMR